MWAEFSDWWTGWRGKDKFQNRDEAWFLFVIGHGCGNAQAIPLQLVCERILNWWRCDGGMDSIGTIMDDLESVLESKQNSVICGDSAALSPENTALQINSKAKSAHD